LRAHPEGVVEPGPVVLQRYCSRQLDQLRCAEVLAQRVEELVRDISGCSRHRRRVPQYELLQGREGLTLLEAWKLAELLLRDILRTTEGEADVYAELAAHHGRRLQYG
jgi:hypothetical protein